MNCAACGAPLPSAARFCPQCARPVGAASLREAPPVAYTPAHLAEKIRGAREAIEGERKRITVLFADLHGSMELVADRDPEEARALFDGVLEWMMEAVHRYEGTVNQILGDGIGALRRAGGARDRGARLLRGAAHAGQHQQLRGEARPGTGELVRIRVGLNSGEVLVRAIAGDLHMDYTAVGQTTHLASRMEQMAEPGTILATAELARLVEGYVQTPRQGERSIRGLAQPVEVFEVLAAVPLRTRVQIAERRGLTASSAARAELAAPGRA